MDKMFWFGWFYKGKLDVSLFDDLMFAVEFVALLLVVALVASAIDWVLGLFGKGAKP